jgi:branched-chain amino acid transport system permease protein
MASVLPEMVSMLINGMGIAAVLFIVSSGLSIIFGVSRVYNFAHGSLYMLGAYITYSIVTRIPAGPLWFLSGIVLAAIGVGCIGLLVELTIIRRIYNAPHHLQIIATFGLFLIIRDVVLMLWGPVQLVTPSVPGFSAPVRLFGQTFPNYYLLMFAMSLVILLGLLLVFGKTRWGVLLRAAIQDRDMVSALGVNQKLLFTSVFVLSAALAGFAGGLDMLRISASLDMDITLIIDAFAVVVIGGMGSIVGTLIASLIVGLLTAVGTVYFQELSLALVFICMAVVLLVRPKGLFGKNTGAGLEERGTDETVLKPATRRARLAWACALAALAVAPFVLSPYWIETLTETIIYVFLAWAFYLLAGPGGLVSFGQAAFFGVGVYVPALLFKFYGLTMVPALILAPLAAGLTAAVVGWVSVRLVGIYFGMLTLAFAQILWSIVYQWMEVTNGEIGILGIWPDRWASDRRVFYFLTLVVSTVGILAMRRLVFAPLGYGLRAARDSAGRADSIGINVRHQKWVAFVVAGTMSGMAGALMVYQKGSAFPAYLDIQSSLDIFVMALLGGLQSLNGPIIGAVIYRFLKIVLQTNFYHWNLMVGLILILVAVFAPRGVSGLISDLKSWRARAIAIDATQQPAPSRKSGGAAAKANTCTF